MGKPKRVIDVDVYEEDEREPRRRQRTPERNSSGRTPKRNIERKIDREEDTDNKASSNSNQGSFDFGQFAGLLQNVDMNQISALLGGLGGNSGGGQGLLGNLAQMMGGAPAPENAPMYNNPFAGDKRMQLLSALRPMVSPERSALIDMVMQIYAISRILRG